MRKVLVIEDSSTIRKHLADVLKRHDFEPVEADNGEMGLALADVHRPDIVLCDVEMPVMDGYETLKALRARPQTVATPFIFLSSCDDQEEIRYGMRLGADDYLHKPVQPEELIRTLEAQIHKYAGLTRVSESKIEHLRRCITLALPHELRTPLTTILSVSEILSSYGTTMSADEVREFASSINTSAARLHHLFENFLAYAQVEFLHSEPKAAAAMKRARTRDAGQFVSDVAFDCAVYANRESDLKRDVQNAIVRVSEEHLLKIVREITDNAFKFSSPGETVFLEAKRGEVYFEIYITDHGRGMAKGHIDRLGAFLQFERQVYEQQGAGLGLVIAKRLIELHDGDLHIESERGKYTRVRIRLPLARERGRSTVSP